MLFPHHEDHTHGNGMLFHAIADTQVTNDPDHAWLERAAW